MNSLHRSLLYKQVMQFGKVGLIGFVVDGSVLSILFHIFNWGHMEARMVSFSVAVGVTWKLNRLYTFKDIARFSRRTEYLVYFLIQLIGALINWAVYILLIKEYDLAIEYPILALISGAIIAFVFNFTAAKTFVFRESAGSA